MVFLKKILFVVIALSLAGCISGISAGENNLWPEEEMVSAAGYPFIVRYAEVKKEAPLLVFIPGRNSLARIFYGGNDTRKEDFLAHWVKEYGYNFLAISYPLVTESGAFAAAHPDITVQAWGRGIAEITKKVMDENALTGKTIVAVWSMAGKSVQPYADAAAALGLDHDFHISLASTPPLPTEYSMNAAFSMHESGVLASPAGAPRARKELEEIARFNMRPDGIIPFDTYLKEYWGLTPAQLLGQGLRYESQRKSIIRDHEMGRADTRFFDVTLPLVGVLAPSWQADARHGITDHATWNYYNAHKIFYDYVGGMSGAQQLTPQQFAAVRTIARSTAQDLLIDIEGNHFFFVGEKGARATVEAIVALEQRIHALKEKLGETLGTQIE